MSKGTKLRTVRVEDDLWAAAKERAEIDNRTVRDVVRDVVREALTMYALTERTPA
ncbi:hypothetical protein [Rhodococcus marinonascens]|uniref:hypothetical protein n=1 Tax=Rhodococcus marinonascens TaxID=38311 RepID=UPI000A703138|nr:hypothetical protein [Rhodococcus marinonascens]